MLGAGRRSRRAVGEVVERLMVELELGGGVTFAVERACQAPAYQAQPMPLAVRRSPIVCPVCGGKVLATRIGVEPGRRLAPA